MANAIIEEKFITALLENKIKLEDVINLGLSERHFQIFPEVFAFIREYEREYDALPSFDLIQAKNGVIKQVPSEDNPVEMAKAIKEAKQTDLFYEEIQRTLKVLEKTGSLARAKDYLSQKLDLFTDDEKDTFDFTDPNFQQGEDDYLLRRNAFITQGLYGIPSGLGSEFDEHLNGGWMAGNLYGLVGNTGVGKSFLAQVIARGGLKAGKKVFYLALEGTLAKEYYRFLTINGEQENTNSRFQKGSMDIEEFKWIQKRVREDAQKNGGKFILGVYGNRDEYTPSILRDKIEQVKPDFVITDYLTLMSDGNSSEEWQMYLRISKRLKNFATRYNIPVIAVLQGTMVSFNNKMDNSNIASSKGIARDMDGIFGISRVDGKTNVIRVNSMKVRDTGGEFDAFYQTGWNSGKIAFLENAGESDGSF